MTFECGTNSTQEDMNTVFFFFFHAAPTCHPWRGSLGAKLKTHSKDEKDAVKVPTAWPLYKETL